MLREDVGEVFAKMYGRPAVKRTFWQKVKYRVNKFVFDNIFHPMKWEMICLVCFAFGHKWKSLLKPDLRKNRSSIFLFFCDRCGAALSFHQVPRHETLKTTGFLGVDGKPREGTPDESVSAGGRLNPSIRGVQPDEKKQKSRKRPSKRRSFSIRF